MADIRTTSNELKIEILFNDTDTRTITLKNPKETITEQEIKDLETMMLNDGITLLIGDKTGSSMNKIKEVTIIKTIKTELDLV